MARQLCPDRPRATLALLARDCRAGLAAPPRPGRSSSPSPGWSAGAGCARTRPPPAPPCTSPSGGALALAALAHARRAARRPAAPAPGRARARRSPCSTASSASGALVFGGGHVVLPLLQAEVVPPGWVTNEQFVAGYGAAQAVPGPLFTFAAYLGASRARRRTAGPARRSRWWRSSCRRSCSSSARCPSGTPCAGSPAFQRALAGINAAVVGTAARGPLPARSGPAPSRGPPTSPSPSPPRHCSWSGTARPGSSCCSPRSAAPCSGPCTRGRGMGSTEHSVGYR